ncbi:MAG: multidrug efflux SMR transporter [Mycobacterium sp.]
MAWLVLVLAGVFEAVWAVALGASDGLRRRGPVIVYFVALVVSLAGLAYAMTTLPTGTAYAVWVGIGASLTVLWSVFRGTEQLTAVKGLMLVLLIGSVVGLKLVS